MSFETVDDPVYLLPKVMDVHGTLIRLGFEYLTAKRIHFYRRFVPLYDGGVPAQFVTRRISHVSFVVIWDQEMRNARMWVKYGYPERYTRGKKIVVGFKPLISTEDHVSFGLGKDQDLRKFERVLTVLLDNLQHKRIDTATVSGCEVLPWDALPAAVSEIIHSRSLSLPTGEWFLDDDYPPKQPDFKTIAVNKYSRLPNFNRSVLRQFNVRPRNVHRRDH